MGRTALLDACVLYPLATRDLLLRGAEHYLYSIRWSEVIMEEVRRNLVEDQRCTTEQAGYLVGQMTTAFPDATVTGYESPIQAVANDTADRHALAAAIAAGADVIVTDNVRHFPAKACDPYGIEVQTADEFLSYSLDLAPDVMGGIRAPIPYPTRQAHLERTGRADLRAPPPLPGDMAVKIDAVVRKADEHRGAV